MNILKMKSKQKIFSYVMSLFILITLIGCGESQPPEISSFLEQDTGMLRDDKVKDCKGFKPRDFPHEDLHELFFSETPSTELYKHNTKSGQMEIRVFGPLQNNINGEEVGDFKNIYMMNKYGSKNGQNWRQKGAASFFEATIDPDTNKVISYKKNDDVVLTFGFMSIALLMTVDSDLEECMKEQMQDLF